MKGWGRKIGKETPSVQSKSPEFLCAPVLLLDLMNKLNIGLLDRLLITLQATSQGLLFLIVFLCPPGTVLRCRPRISSWSWPAAGTRPSARLTVWVPCGPGPSSYLTDPIIQRAALWVTPLLTRPKLENTTMHHTLLNCSLLQTGSDLTWVEDWLHLHVARVRDVELLTGLSFYHDRLSVAETLQLKTFIHNNRGSEWSHNVQRKPCWFCPPGLRPQRHGQSRSENTPCVQTQIQPDIFYLFNPPRGGEGGRGRWC